MSEQDTPTLLEPTEPGKSPTLEYESRPVLHREGQGSSIWRWSVVGLLFCATVLNYLDRQTISITVSAFSKEFNLTNEQYGELLAAFRWAYGSLHVPAGYLVDRFSVRGFYAIAVAFWSLAGAAAFWVPGARAFYASRVALGLAEAFNWPCALRVTANILPRRDRSLGNGIFNSGAAIGALIAPRIIVPIALGLGWRYAFLIVGALGGLWVVGWLLLTGRKNSNRSIENPAPIPRHERKPFVLELGQILATPGFWILVIGAGTINPCWYFVTEWSVKYLQDQHGMVMATAANVTIPIFLFADLGNIGGGGFLKYLVGRGRSMRFARAVTVSSGAALVFAAILANYVGSAALCIALLSIAAFGITVLMTSLLGCYQDFSLASTGLVMGLLGGFGCVVSATVNPYIGRYIDHSHNYNLIFILLGLTPLLTMSSILLFDIFNRTPQGDD